MGVNNLLHYSQRLNLVKVDSFIITENKPWKQTRFESVHNQMCQGSLSSWNTKIIKSTFCLSYVKDPVDV